MKKLALIGASGFIGSAILNEALNRGHQVTAIVRNPEKINIKHDNLQIKSGDIMDEALVTELVTGNEIVISSYNPGWSNPNIAEDTIKGYTSIVNGVKKAKIKRLLIVGGAGSLYVDTKTRLMDTDTFPKEFLQAVEALAKVLYKLQEEEKELNWAFFSPAANIFPGIRTGKFRLGKDQLISHENGESKISVEDYAVAMINEVEYPVHSRQRFTIGY